MVTKNVLILKDIQKVFRVLYRRKETRDSDTFLYYYLLKEELKVEPTQITAFDLLKGMKDGKYPKFDSVKRLRRKLQEERPTLRGKLWYERHKWAEEIKEELF